MNIVVQHVRLVEYDHYCTLHSLTLLLNSAYTPQITTCAQFTIPSLYYHDRCSWQWHDVIVVIASCLPVTGRSNQVYSYRQSILESASSPQGIASWPFSGTAEQCVWHGMIWIERWNCLVMHCKVMAPMTLALRIANHCFAQVCVSRVQ